ncbi:hypothetical protein ARMSODRAFT_289252 [Armillaria solidipes]|uniref:Uncharacterized protein n=1 Tax=Armillaria solidipes TaxID=1076256 RepID=A0A2H3CN89_9AGAR|nr:hypothetical protein ARMSODRAFT_289252 [Armillaria solidipes]
MRGERMNRSCKSHPKRDAKPCKRLNSNLYTLYFRTRSAGLGGTLRDTRCLICFWVMLKQRLRGRVPMLERISIEAIFMGQENKNCAVAFSIMSITSPNSYGYSLYPLLSYYISGIEPILKTPLPNSHKAFIISMLPPLDQN